MRLDSVHFSMLVVGVSLACYSPSLNSLQDQAHRSAVVIEGKVQSAPANANASAEPYSVHVKVLDVWPRNSGGLEREQLVTVGDFGSAAPCATVLKNHKYIFFMEPTDEPLVFKASFAPLDTSAKNLKKDVGRILCDDCAQKLPQTGIQTPVSHVVVVTPWWVVVLTAELHQPQRAEAAFRVEQCKLHHFLSFLSFSLSSGFLYFNPPLSLSSITEYSVAVSGIGAPTLKPMRNPVVVGEGSRLTMKCEASGTTPLLYKWYKDGSVLKKSKEVKIKENKKNSKVQIASARLEDSGNYMCVVENEGGSSNSTSTVHVQSIRLPQVSVTPGLVWYNEGLSLL
ncbi:hypothetical protein NFI96_002735 [Prochilodus magdalenae]|nr:hypothetical protein NFI96_002735 [Prochilodus magdalenae]